MGDSSDRPDDDWSHVVGKWTFISTMILAALYVGTVFVFILAR